MAMGHAALALFGSVVNGIEGAVIRHARRRQNLRYGRRQRGLAMVNVAYRADVHVGLFLSNLCFAITLIPSETWSPQADSNC